MMYKILIVIMIMWDTNEQCVAKSILAIIPTPSYSHHTSFRPVILELVKQGHKVTVITSRPTIYEMDEIQPNLTTIGVSVPATEWDENLYYCLTNKCDTYAQLMSILNILPAIFEAQMKTDGVQNLILDKRRKFDLVFYERTVRAAIGFSYLYTAPAIEISSGGGMTSTFNEVGAMIHPLLYPFPFRQRIHNLTLWEKISEIYMQLSIEYSYKTQLEEVENNMLKRIFGPDVPDLNILRKNIQLLFLNIHQIWDFNRPVPPNVIYLGGLTNALGGLKMLPEDLKSYLDSSRNGVIYISFGTRVEPSKFSKLKQKILTDTIASLPYDVLLKWSDNTLQGQPKNVKIAKWLPQLDVLKHPKLKLFITHGGLQSTMEAVEAGVPVIVLPQVNDQFFNAEQCVIHGIGIKLDMETITEAKFKEAVGNIIGNKSYRENVEKLRNIMRDQPQSSLERALWWTEYVLRHGGATHLRAAAAHVPWTHYYMLDVAVPFLILITTILIIITILIRIIFKRRIIFSYKVKNI